MKKVFAILFATFFVVSLILVAASARGGGGSHGSGGDYGVGEEGDYGPSGIYNTPYYEGNQNEDYAAVNQPD
jgi:hypothetical protein